MKIVFSTDQIYLHGGIEKVMAEKANYFADVLGYEVTILTTEQKDQRAQYTLSKAVKQKDLRVNYNRSKSYLSSQNIAKLPLHFWRLRKALNQINPEMVIVCNYAFDFYWYPFIHKSSKKIKEFHGSQFCRENQKATSSLKERIGNWFQLQIEKRYDTLLVLNPDEQRFFKSDNTFVIPNPIEIPKRQATLGNKKVLAAGRIAPVKGFERLIDIWAVVVAEHPKWELHIYGDDYLNTKSKLEKQIKDLNIEKNILFKGLTSKMTETMLDYSIYLMTSHTECFPMVLLESLSVGLPIVAFDVPTGPRNIIVNKQNGLLVENNDKLNFVIAVNSLIIDEEKRKIMGSNAKSTSLRFANSNVMKKWSRLFYNLKDR